MTSITSTQRMSRFDPRRIALRAYARAQNRLARYTFHSWALPLLPVPVPETDLDYNQGQTAVEPHQMRVLLAALGETERFAHTTVAEVGAYLGETTCVLAARTGRRVVAIDPYLGGSAPNAANRDIFLNKTAGQANISLLHMLSAEAAAAWPFEPPSLVFIDAMHDYLHTGTDGRIWSALVPPGGLVAFHDCDNRRLAGTRRAVFEMAKTMDLYAHVDNLAVFRKRG